MLPKPNQKTIIISRWDMFKLASMIVMAVLLLPQPAEDSLSSVGKTEALQSFDVSGIEALSALYSVYDDLSRFCARNQESCMTGEAFFGAVVSTVSGFANTKEPQTPDSHERAPEIARN